MCAAVVKGCTIDTDGGMSDRLSTTSSGGVGPSGLTAGLTAEDRKRFVKLFRIFVYKAVEVIVQSRSGRKHRWSCKPQATAYFNINMEDDPEIAAEVKRTLTNRLELRPGDSVNVEIFLNTAENQKLFLEVWSARLQDAYDPELRHMRSYERLSTVLRSLFSVTRLLPAYRIARSQSYDNYLMCYNISQGTATCACLGPGYKNRRVATLTTAAGQLVLNCSYRTQMTLLDNDAGTFSSASAKCDEVDPLTLPRRGHLQLHLSDNHFQNEMSNAEQIDSTGDKTPYLSNSTPPPPPLPPRRKSSIRSAAPFAATILSQQQVNVSDEAAEDEDEDDDEEAKDIPFSCLMPSGSDSRLSDSCGRQEETLADGDSVVSRRSGDSDEDNYEEENEDTSVIRKKRLALGGSLPASLRPLPFAEYEEDFGGEMARGGERVGGGDLSRMVSLRTAPELQLFCDVLPLAEQLAAVEEDLDRHEHQLADFDTFLNELLMLGTSAEDGFSASNAMGLTSET